MSTIHKKEHTWEIASRSALKRNKFRRLGKGKQIITREEVQKATADYLARGGVITVIEFDPSLYASINGYGAGIDDDNYSGCVVFAKEKRNSAATCLSDESQGRVWG